MEIAYLQVSDLSKKTTYVKFSDLSKKTTYNFLVIMYLLQHL